MPKKDWKGSLRTSEHGDTFGGSETEVRPMFRKGRSMAELRSDLAEVITEALTAAEPNYAGRIPNVAGSGYSSRLGY